MRTKDGLLAGGVVVAIMLSLFAVLSRPGGETEPQKLAPAPPPRVPAGLERKLAAAESRARNLEDALGLLEKRLEKRIADIESRKPPVAAAHPAIPMFEIPEEFRNMGRRGFFGAGLGHGTGNIAIGDAAPARKLAKALDLTKDQRARVGEILEKFKEVVDDKLPAGREVKVATDGAGDVGMTGTLRKLQGKLKKRLAKVLDGEQRKKLDALVASKGLPLAGANTVWHFRETPGGVVSVSSTSVRDPNMNAFIEFHMDGAGVLAPPPAGGDAGGKVGDPGGVF